MAKAPDQCQYFLLCERKAVTTLHFPAIGPVPCCRRCAAFVKKGTKYVSEDRIHRNTDGDDAKAKRITKNRTVKVSGSK